MSKTLEHIYISQSCEDYGKHALALLHLNAAAVFAACESPEHVPMIRETIDHYRRAYQISRRQGMESH